MKELKIIRERCKQETGVLRHVAQNPNIDISRSNIVGDSAKDIEAGKKAGLKTALIIGDGRASPSDAPIVTYLAEYALLGVINQLLEDA